MFCLAKDYRRVSLLTVVSKVFEKLVNSRLVDHVEECGLFSFPVWLQVFSVNCRFLTVVSDRIARAFNRSGASLAVAFNILGAFDRVLYPYFLNKR